MEKETKKYIKIINYTFGHTNVKRYPGCITWCSDGKTFLDAISMVERM